jgi:hypothetical protein
MKMLNPKEGAKTWRKNPFKISVHVYSVHSVTDYMTLLNMASARDPEIVPGRVQLAMRNHACSVLPIRCWF